VRIAVIGGGPGGLYFSALVKRLEPGHEITVWERNAADDTFGFGVVFSDETLGGIEHADPAVYAAMERGFARWGDIDVRYRDETITSGGHGFAAMGRRELLGILRRRCADLGVDIRFRTVAPDAGELRRAYDLVIAADGVNSAVRGRYADVFRPSLDVRNCRYMWLGTDRVFEAFTFDIRRTPYGVMQMHGYPYDAHTSTFIVEMHDDVWRRAGFEDFATARDFRPGESDERSAAKVSELFAEALDGHGLLLNNSRWLTFTTVRNERWVHDNLVLLGDAAHTAHFSIGSGTKLAMEDALSLAACLRENGELSEALAAYERERRPVVLSTQRAAQASLEWFENIDRYLGQEPIQFAFNLLTRSRRVTYDNLRLRDPQFVARVDEWFADLQLPDGHGDGNVRPPMFQPFRLGDLELANRVIVSPMDMYMAAGGVPGDFHLVHLGGKALGGAGLVMTEMVCVSPQGRITPGCTGLWNDEQAAAWARICDFVHSSSRARIGVQLGHSGRKGSTKVMWEGMDEPLDEGNWPVVSASALPYREGVSQVPAALDRPGMDAIREEFVAAARRAAVAGFDLLELHCAHGYLLSSFLSPVTNRRDDEYGGPVENRLRFPLEVFTAVRRVWPAGRPMTVRVSATDWTDDGISLADTLAVARAFERAGAAAIDVSTGQVTPDEQPAFGRSYQTPFADAIRNRLGIPAIAVGAISSADDVNTIVLAGRADLCALARVHLYDPNWTLHAAADQDYDPRGSMWPDPWRPGRRKPQTGRADVPRPRLQLAGAAASNGHRRWTSAELARGDGSGRRRYASRP
jgi:anthraniloyl-CoA monooxygenase